MNEAATRVVMLVIIKTIKQDGEARGLLFVPLMDSVTKATGCTSDEFKEARLFGMDEGTIEERQPGWISVKA